MDEKKNVEPLASEMYQDLKDTNNFLRKMLVGAILVIALLVVGIVANNIYHIHKWSQFDTYVVDSDSGGYANLVHGDNTGGIFNGTDSSQNPQEVGGEVEGLPG